MHSPARSRGRLRASSGASKTTLARPKHGGPRASGQALPTADMLAAAQLADPDFSGALADYLHNVKHEVWGAELLESIGVKAGEGGWQLREPAAADLAPELETLLSLVFHRLGGSLGRGVTARMLEDGDQERLLRRRRYSAGATRNARAE